MAKTRKTLTTRAQAAQPAPSDVTPVAAAVPQQDQTVAAPAPKAASKPVTVALRGGAAVAQVALVPGATYRTKAAHNVAWWQAIGAAVQAGQGKAAVAQLVAQAPAGAGVPAHFVGYCLRRGYLQAA